MQSTQSIFLNLFFSCKNLSDKDTFSKSDPMIEVFLDNKFVGRTEMIKNSLNPFFSTPIKIQYFFQKLQNILITIIDVDDVKTLKGERLGNVSTTLGAIVSQEPGSAFTLPVQNGKGTVTITYEEITSNSRNSYSSQYTASAKLVTQEMKKGTVFTKVNEQFIINMKGIDLEKKDWFGKSDPYYYIYRLVGTNKIQLYKSETIMKNLNPIWAPAYLNIQMIDSNCMSQNQRFLIEVWDYDKVGSDDFIGSIELFDLFYGITPQGKEFKGIIKDKNRKNKDKKRGEIIMNIRYEMSSLDTVINKYSVIANYDFVRNLYMYPNLKSSITFIDAMRMGMKLHIVCAVDYTSSNGNMHDVIQGQMNPYQTALSAVGQVLEPYDHDRRFSFFGYGGTKNGIFPPYFTVGESEEVENGVQGILDTYARTRNLIVMGDMGSAKGGDMLWRANNDRYYCDDFYQIINAVADKAEADMMTKFAPGSHILPTDYYILFFVIDGDGFDMTGTIRSLVRASSLPMSIVLIGVGNSNFNNLSKFDADGIPLSCDGVSTIRDIVQFVKFNDCKNSNGIDMYRLSSEVLAEVPNQVETFIGLYGCTVPEKKNELGYSFNG